MRWVRHPELDIDVLVRRAGSQTRFCGATGADPRAVRRARAGGLTIDQADRYAVALGTHPAEVWAGWEQALHRDSTIREQATKQATQRRRERQRHHNQRRGPRTNPLVWRNLALQLAGCLATHDLTDEDRATLQLLEIRNG